MYKKIKMIKKHKIKKIIGYRIHKKRKEKARVKAKWGGGCSKFCSAAKKLNSGSTEDLYKQHSLTLTFDL